MPEDPAEYSRRAWPTAGYFEASRLTEEDLDAQPPVPANARAGLEADGDRHGAYLARLDMEIDGAVSTARAERIVQLINKTNQFNLNPKIFTAEEIRASADGVFALRFKDRLQDYGIAAVAVAGKERMRPSSPTG